MPTTQIWLQRGHYRGFDWTEIHLGTHLQRLTQLAPGTLIAAHNQAQSWLEYEFQSATVAELKVQIDANYAQSPDDEAIQQLIAA
jgi:hypothetical protein